MSFNQKVLGKKKHQTNVAQPRWNGRGIEVKTITYQAQSPTKSPNKSPHKRARTEEPEQRPDDEEWLNDDVPQYDDAPRKTKTQRDYLEEWATNHRETWSNIILERQEPPNNRICQGCAQQDGDWRCGDCLGQPIFCKACCRENHLGNPFHRISTWRGTHYSPDWLWAVGVSISLGHGGMNCPNPTVFESDEIFAEENVGEGKAESTSRNFHYNSKPPGSTLNGHKVLSIVHTNGIHHLPVIPCGCPGQKEAVVQHLLELKLWPASFEKVQTVFTEDVLEDNRLSNLECYTTSFQYYQKLRRLTNPAFPESVANRYAELHRVKREWRYVKDLCDFGLAHTGKAPGKQEMAHFCAACPQPGINIPDDWELEPAQWRYHRSFVADGNFSLVHDASKNIVEDFWMKKGEGFLTERNRYRMHLSAAVERKDRPTCNEHRALNDRSKIHKGCDVTGIGAIACMRHGAFVPGAQVDFQKGERQMNMDYALSEALQYGDLSKVPYLIFGYDVNCQYSVHHATRVAASEYLKIPEGVKKIFYAIGTWHVHGHKPACYPRYATTFIQGSGVRSAEILESRWSLLNRAANSLRHMTLAHRAEMLDAFMNDVNWKTILGMVQYVSTSYLKALEERDQAADEFEKIDCTSSVEQRKLWSLQERTAHMDRLDDVSAMDIYDSNIQQAPAGKKVQLDLMEEEMETGNDVGLSSWIALGIEIQQDRCYLDAFKAQLSPVPTVNQELTAAKMQERMSQKMVEFLEDAGRLFPTVDFDDLLLPNGGPRSFEFVPLPSQILHCPPALRAAAEKEIELRVGEANDALKAIRSEIGFKSYLFRKQVRPYNSKNARTRGWTNVKRTNQDLRTQVKIYHNAVSCLKSLDAGQEILSAFKPLEAEDLVTNTAIADPNARGQSKIPLAWFWGMNVAGDSKSNEYMEELYRVNWLRRKAAMQRWEEECILLRSEMGWTRNYFKSKSQEWDKLAESTQSGKRCFAYQQKEMWDHLYDYASLEFEAVIRSTLRQYGG